MQVITTFDSIAARPRSLKNSFLFAFVVVVMSPMHVFFCLCVLEIVWPGWVVIDRLLRFVMVLFLPCNLIYPWPLHRAHIRPKACVFLDGGITFFRGI